MDFVLNCLHDLKFESLNFVDFKFLVSDLLVNGFHLERVDVFELGSNKHTRDACDVQVADFLWSGCILQEAILKINCQEESLVIALKVCKHFNHPVDHSCSKSCCDLVSLQAVTCVVLLLEMSQVRINVLLQLVLDVDILALEVGCVGS
jgi:hypothetical protein